MVEFDLAQCEVTQYGMGTIILKVAERKSYYVDRIDPEGASTEMPTAADVLSHLQPTGGPLAASSSSSSSSNAAAESSNHQVCLSVFTFNTIDGAADAIAQRYMDEGCDFARPGYALKRIVAGLAVPPGSIELKLNRTGPCN